MSSRYELHFRDLRLVVAGLLDGQPHPFVSEMKILDAVMKDKYTVMNYSNISVAEIPASEFSLESVR